MSEESSACVVRKRRWLKLLAFRIRGLRVVLFGLAVAGSSIGAYLLAQSLGQSLRSESAATTAPTEFASSGLVVSAADLNLGEVWEATEFVRVLSIRNPSRTEKKIEDFATSCLCTSIEPRTIVIPPGGEATVQVRIDPNHQRSPDEANLATRPFAVEIRPILGTTVPGQPGWSIHGQFKSRVTLGALAMHFGEEVIRGEPSPTHKVTATIHVPMQRVEARIEPTVAGTVRLVPFADHPNQMELQISPANTLPTGSFNASVILDVVEPSGTVASGAVLPIAGEVQPEARLLPASVILGVHPVGSTAQAVVALQAPAETQWTVDHIETDSSDVSVEATIADGIPDGRAFRVSRRSIREGNQTDKVHFFVRKAGGAQTQLVMVVMCHGELPHPALVPEKGGKKQ